ncbi:MAG: hydrogenase maturation protease [Phycisphaerae bacterium]|nr:hydrogenase maturation protease [Phycisphaerae bacterium]
MTNKTVVLALGNPLMADEGIGIEIVDALLADAGKYPGVDFIDAGCGGMTLLHYYEGRDKAIIIDCAFMETEPGTIKRFVPEDVTSVKKLSHHSLHEVDILNVIKLADQMGSCPGEIVFFGIEPESVEQQQSLTPLLQRKFSEYIEIIKQEFVK